ncbi:MAG: hypothetical protein K2L13_02715, partial [Opitutales bacterium]|nr:hypothetical protein [Opitutales bacterium]
IDDKMLNPVDDDASIATYYRLLAADMIPQCQKCIYLDADVIVLSDLTELYNIDLGDNYIAGVKDLPSIFTYEKMYWNFLPQKIDKISDLLDFSNYVNGGVLVMNLELIRKHKINEKFKFMVQHGIDDKSSYPYHDQDIINIACNGHIKCIDLAYNFMPNFISVVKEKLDQAEYTAQQLEAIITSPVIIHYAMEKPWNQPFNDFFAIWWRYAHEAALQGKFIQISNKFNEI